MQSGKPGPHGKLDLLFDLFRGPARRVKGMLFCAHLWPVSAEIHFYQVWPLVTRWLRNQALITVPAVSLSARSFAAAFCCDTRRRSPSSSLLHAGWMPSRWKLDRPSLARGRRKVLLKVGGAGLPLDADHPFPALIVAYRGWRQYGFFPQTIGYTITALFFGCILIRHSRIVPGDGVVSSAPSLSWQV